MLPDPMPRPSKLGTSPEKDYACAVMASLLQSLKSQWAVGAQSQSKEPLYHQLYLLLRNSITNGTVEFGEQMPTEQQLSDTFGLSRITVKRAMDELAADDLIARRRGKGSHVTYQYLSLIHI